MNPTEKPPAPRELLTQGARQIYAGELAIGADLVYQAASAAVRDAASRRGWPCETHADAQAAACRLDGREPPASLSDAVNRGLDAAQPPPAYSLLFGVAVSYRLHGAAMRQDGRIPSTFWADDDYAAHLPPIRKLLDLLADNAAAAD